MNNKSGEQLTVNDQYKKLHRALRLILNVEISNDDYFAIVQLMSNVETDVCLVLDNTLEEETTNA
jgi:hypothetical protein